MILVLSLPRAQLLGSVVIETGPLGEGWGAPLLLSLMGLWGREKSQPPRICPPLGGTSARTPVGHEGRAGVSPMVSRTVCTLHSPLSCTPLFPCLSQGSPIATSPFKLAQAGPTPFSGLSLRLQQDRD